MKRAFLLLVFIIVLALITSFYQKTELVHQHEHSSERHKGDARAQTQNTHSEHKGTQHEGHDHQHGSSNADSQPTSSVPLDPEIREALKKQLLLEGPMQTITRPDGRIELPSNGRTTQMPVAIQHPDGTIEIKEYSVVPKEESQ